MKWWEVLLDLFAGILTKQQLSELTQDKDALAGAVTGRFDAPTLGTTQQQDEERWRRKAVDFMRTQLGKGYDFGHEVKPGDEEDSPLWDCSEFTEAASRVAGWSPVLPDGAWQQHDVCRPVNQAKAGDLGFLWSDKRQMIGHVMMFTGEGTVIHAVAGRGVVEDPESQWTGHVRWRGIRRPPCFSMRDHGLAG